MSVIMDILALLMQCSVFFLMTRYSTTEGVFITDMVQLLELAASLFLISFRYWENFIDRDIGAIGVQSFKQTLRLGRCKTYIFASLWKIALTLAFAYLLVPDMTPIADIFNHIANESAYDNKTNLLSLVPSSYDLENPANVSDLANSINIPDYYQDFEPQYTASYTDDYNRIVSRAKRQANGSFLDSDTSDRDEEDDFENIRSDDTDINDYVNGGGDEDPRLRRGRNRLRPGSTRRPRTRHRRPRQPTPPPVNPDLFEYDSQTESDTRPINKILYRFLPLIVQAASGAICYYFSRVACKLCMQGFSLSLPLTFITPATAAIFCYLCHLEDWQRIMLPNLSIGHWTCSEIYLDETFHWQIGCALGLWWLSQLWVCNHMWFSKSERLAKVERCANLISFS